MKNVVCAVTTAAMVSLGALTAQAAPITIDFGPLAGANGDPYAGHVEDTFTVSSTAGEWFEAQFFGNPTPSIFAGPVGAPSATSTIEVTGGLFNFLSVDLACNNGADCSATILGYFGGIEVYNQADGVTAGPPFVFETTNSTNAGVVLDKLVISFSPGSGTTSLNLDNIVLSRDDIDVPEPALLSLMALALGGAVRMRRRRAQ